MLKKLALDKTKEYEKYLALDEISVMLVKFVKGNVHDLAIGAEQGDIDKWDDLVIQTHDEKYIHIQAKRQTSSFSTDCITRDKYTKGSKDGKLKCLSPLDEAFRCLKNRFDSNAISQRIFKLIVPEPGIEIKKGLEIRHLRIFKDTIKSVTTSKELAALASINENVNNIYLWLTTWCEFQNWDQILQVFIRLEIVTAEYEYDIELRAKKILTDIFRSEEICTVRNAIFAYISDNSTFAGAIMPRQLLYLLQKYLLPNIPKWTLFTTDGSSWNVSGILDLENNAEYERPSVIVPLFWSSNNEFFRLLKIYGPCLNNCLITTSLMRLSLHPIGSFNILCSQKAIWENEIGIKTGGTLGVSIHDFKDLRILDSDEIVPHIESMHYMLIDKKEKLAEALNSEMYKVTYGVVDNELLRKIAEMNRSNLRSEIELRWIEWRSTLENSVDKQRELFAKILYARAEGKSICGELRVGLKTTRLLVEAIFLLLVVSVCISDANNHTWNAVTDSLSITAIGLAFWGGPAGGKKVIIPIDQDPAILNLLENEPEQIVIIPQSVLTDDEILNDDLTGVTKIQLLSHPRYPKLLITRDRRFNRLLEEGDIHNLKSYFESRLDKYKKSIYEAINEMV